MALPQEALSLGLVDEVVEKVELLPAAERAVQRLMKVPGHARHATKLDLHGEFCKQWTEFCRTESTGAWQFLNQPATVKTLGATMQRLSGGKPAAKL